MTVTAEYGFWKSPITSDLVAAESVRLNEPRLDGDAIYWLEGRPAERGRTVPVRWDPDGSIRDALPPPWNVRSRVHEYGGGAYAVAQGSLYFVENRGQRLYREEPSGTCEPLTPESAARYADIVVDVPRNRVLAVCEDHSATGREAVQSIVAVDWRRPGQAPCALVSGADFYSNPRLSPDGSRMCWLEWNHPNMPWDGTELWTGEFSPDGNVVARHKVAGGPRESIFQPQWSPGGLLHFVSDRNGFWNLYLQRANRARLLYKRDAEFGLPQWVFGMSTFGFAADGRVLCAYGEDGVWSMGIVAPDGEFTPVDTPYSQIDDIVVCGSTAVFRAASPRESSSLVRLDLASGESEVLRRSSAPPDEIRKYFSVPEPICCSVPSGNRDVHAFYYAPRNPDFEAPTGEPPPLIIRLHGGPTGAASNALQLAIQFWTSRGFAYVDLNYAGSTGFGRAYRERINGEWGASEVEDTVQAARSLVALGLADPGRMIVKGASAGGYTVLRCLSCSDLFAAGASYYGIGDLRALAGDDHKFESRYLHRLVGPWPEAEALYSERSPLLSAGSIEAPTIFFQGSEDRVVPQAQAAAMVSAMRNNNIPVAYYLFEGESHGFRDGENIKRSLDAELGFYGTFVLKGGLRF